MRGLTIFASLVCGQAAAADAAAQQLVVELQDSTVSGISGSLNSCLEGTTISHRYTSSIFTGFAVDVPEPHRHHDSQSPTDDVFACLQKHPHVGNVWHSPRYHLSSTSNPAADGQEKLLSASSRLLHQSTGVDTLHSSGINGSGIRIAIIDDGVDYLHPALGGGFGPDFTVSYGQSLWSGASSNQNASDPYSDCEHHGTHVTGIIAGYSPSLGFVGVAPAAKVEMYRVLGCGRDGNAAAQLAGPVLQAVLAAYERGVDVISMSLGFLSGPYPGSDPISQILGRIAAQGKTVPVVSVGNWGWQGAFTGTAPAAAPGVLSVGALVGPGTQQSWPIASFEVDDGRGGGDDKRSTFTWSVAGPSRFPETLPLCAWTLDPTVRGDACASTSGALPDSSQCIVLVRRGDCPLSVKMDHVSRAGAQYALIYHNVSNEALFTLANSFEGMLGVGAIAAETGEHFVSLLASGHTVRLHMDSDFTLTPQASSFDKPILPAGMASPHTTWGPSGNMALLPSVLSPGISILSTYPRTFGGFGVLSGSSMATPYAAGCVALVQQAHPDLDAVDIIRRVTSTAGALPFSDGTEDAVYPFLAPTWQQGGGRLNCSAAAYAATTVDSVALAVNDTDFFRGSHTFTVTNNGQTMLAYTLSHHPAVSVLALRKDNATIETLTTEPTGTHLTADFMSQLAPDLHARVTIDPVAFTLTPKTSRTVRVTFDIDDVFNSTMRERCPLYSGFIGIHPAGDYDLSVPYGGAACRMRSVPVLLDNNETFVAAATIAQTDGSNPYAPFAGRPVEPNTVFENTTLFPTVNIQVAMCSRHVTVDVIPAPLGADDPSSASALIRLPVSFGGDTADSLSRASPRWIRWSGALGGGRWAPEGRYCFRVCAVRMWEDPADAAAVRDCVLTAPFVLSYENPGGVKSAFLCDLDSLL